MGQLLKYFLIEKQGSSGGKEAENFVGYYIMWIVNKTKASLSLPVHHIVAAVSVWHFFPAGVMMFRLEICFETINS